MDKLNIFIISIQSLNLFSFMLGMTFAAFQSWYGRTAFKYIIFYFASLALYYWVLYYNATHTTH